MLSQSPIAARGKRARRAAAQATSKGFQRRQPWAAAPPPPGFLRIGPAQGALGRALERQPTGLVIRAADRLVAVQPKALGERGHAVCHRRNSDFAATSAPPTTGSGIRIKNIVSTAVTTSTHLSSGAIGRSKAPTGSSKYMTLTMRR